MQTGQVVHRPPSLATEAKKLFHPSGTPPPSVPIEQSARVADASSAQLPPSSPGGDSGEASALPSVSPEFQAELAALLGYYAARMAAVRGSVSPRDVAAALQAIANEQAVAMRALLDRWRAAEERQRAERPMGRPGPGQDQNPKPS